MRATYRYAKRQGKPRIMVFPDGTVTPEGFDGCP